MMNVAALHAWHRRVTSSSEYATLVERRAALVLQLRELRNPRQSFSIIRPEEITALELELGKVRLAIDTLLTVPQVTA